MSATSRKWPGVPAAPCSKYVRVRTPHHWQTCAFLSLPLPTWLMPTQPPLRSLLSLPRWSQPCPSQGAQAPLFLPLRGATSIIPCWALGGAPAVVNCTHVSPQLRGGPQGKTLGLTTALCPQGLALSEHHECAQRPILLAWRKVDKEKHKILKIASLRARSLALLLLPPNSANPGSAQGSGAPPAPQGSLSPQLPCPPFVFPAHARAFV